ncbi:MAG: hypothetical protein J0H43_09950 [Actinobacteria bacterium]|nr:hypothetical protein [Actinomycetota bacterium]
MRFTRPKSAAAALLLTAGSLVGGVFAAPAAFANCTDCEGAQFTGNGVRIHSCASESCTTVGLGYKDQTVGVICVNPVAENGFVHIHDETTNVIGWASEQYVTWACD